MVVTGYWRDGHLKDSINFPSAVSHHYRELKALKKKRNYLQKIIQIVIKKKLLTKFIQKRLLFQQNHAQLEKKKKGIFFP